MSELIITEKPATERKIAEALSDGKLTIETHNGVKCYKIVHKGKDILVGSAVGHLYGLTEVKKDGLNYPNFDVEWKALADIDKKAAFSKKYLNTLKKISKNVDKFTIATDYDIEGEVIGWNILRFVCKKDNGRRMKFSALTKKDLVDAYNNASDEINWTNAIAGEARHIMDWYWGINLSKAMTSAIKKGGMFKIMSIGRVQGPALNIVVEREQSIKDFKAKPYWVVDLISKFNDEEIEAIHKKEEFWEEKEATDVVSKCDSKDGVIKKIDKKEKKYVAPNPFDLTSLQVESYGVFGIAPKRTLEIAQELYTNGLISYPRTSSQQFPSSIDFKKILSDLQNNKEYVDLVKTVLKTKLVPNNGKKTDPAHPAIYPTGVLLDISDKDEKRVFDLIVKRFFATFGDPAVRESQNIQIDVEKEIFVTKGSVTKDKGWYVLYEPYVRVSEKVLPIFKIGDVLKNVKVTSNGKETQPPKRYTPASIIKELEKRNLGTKATRAQIVETLVNRGYVKGKSLEATELGMKMINVLSKYCPDIINEDLTRKFEDELAKIEGKNVNKEKVLEDAREVLIKIIDEFKTKEVEIGKLLFEANKETEEKESLVGDCFKCDGDLRIKKGKFGMFVACSNYPDCKETFSLPSGALIKGSGKICDECKYPKVLAIRRRERPQEVCINVECPLKKISSDKEGSECNKCSKGKFVIRKSVYGQFLSCDQFPRCKNIVRSKK